jgi:hypothetical protein
MSDSTEGEIRCKTCGKKIDGGTFTIRANSNQLGERIRSQARFLMGRLQCQPCAAKEGKR